MATPAQQAALVNLYIALFNRAPDAEGFAFWTSALDRGATLDDISVDFVRSTEAATIYPTSQNAEQFVTAFYQSVFGRAPDADGLEFWTRELDAAGGPESPAAKALLVSKIIEIVTTPLPEKPADLSDAQYAETVKDRGTFGTKNVAATKFLESNSNDINAAKQALIPVTTPAPTQPAGKVFDLTTADETLNGGAGNDTFNAPLANGLITLNTGDILDGGEGKDTLNVELASCTYPSPTLRNIETVNVRSLGYSYLNLERASGVTHINVANSDYDVTINNVGDAALSVANQTANVSFNGGTATELSLNLNNVGTNPSVDRMALLLIPSETSISLGYNATYTKHNIVTTDSSVRIIDGADSPAVTEVSVAATGTNRLVLSETDVAAIQTITVSGSGSVSFGGDSLTALTTFTAGDGGVNFSSNNQTASSLTISTGAGQDDIEANAASIVSLNTGAGNDYVYLDGALSATAVVNLGAGDDTIYLTQGAVEGARIYGGDGDDTFVMNAVTHAVNGEGGSVTTLTGGAGTDTYVFRTEIVGTTAGKVTAVITDFKTGEDKIEVQSNNTAYLASEDTFKKASTISTSLEALLVEATAALSGTTLYYVGQFGTDAYLVTDFQTAGYTNVIKLEGVSLAGIVATDMQGQVAYLPV
ncbi:DUF4214 domain-containing protein [Pigmentiphaga aceris]|uniref:DUF4214 domain-containing protein n=1 Tax=Pigmentiphaga aceris TaxID=1940612 RepID=A0A5C0AUC3_9BURK|nr:DUF4214 domain-containing protein [Pigmentiphaga aceris]QEI05274.1 DUF4214 domain-containing protein [Pigmentiphaga aceris]